AGVPAGPKGLGRQPVAHGGDLVLGLEARGGGGAEGGRNARGFGPLGPRSFPSGECGLLGEGELDGVAGLERIKGAGHLATESLLPFARQDANLSGDAMLEGVEPRTPLTKGGRRALTLPPVLAADLGVIGGGGGGHRGWSSLRCGSGRRRIGEDRPTAG